MGKRELVGEAEAPATFVAKGSLLYDAMEALDMFLNAASGDDRKKASRRGKEVYARYHGKEFKYRNER